MFLSGEHADASVHLIRASDLSPANPRVRELRDRYAALILAALRNVSNDPHQANIHWRRFRKGEIGVYHLENSRDRVPADSGRVAAPRHYVVFSLRSDGDAEILGLVHDSMLLERVFRRLVSGSGDNRR